MLKVIRRQWLPLLVLLMVVIGGFVISRMHGIFGSDNQITREGSGINSDAKPFNPKQVTYEVFGPVGAIATINYLDLSANPQSVKVPPALVAHADYHSSRNDPDIARPGQRRVHRLPYHHRRQSQR